jgi:hypothetical protein
MVWRFVPRIDHSKKKSNVSECAPDKSHFEMSKDNKIDKGNNPTIEFTQHCIFCDLEEKQEAMFAAWR